MATLSAVHALPQFDLPPAHEPDQDAPAARRCLAAPVSICIPAHNEEATIGRLVSDIQRTLVRSGVVGEVVVIDDRSHDATARVARAAGARVVTGCDILPSFGPGLGKGDAMWRSLAVSTGDIVVWCDADLHQFDAARLGQLVQPLLDDPRIKMSKGWFRRVHPEGGPTQGGRVTELVARPLLGMLFPDTRHIREPLGGIVAMRRDAAERLSFEPDYGVDVGLLIDTVQRWGRAAVTQVDLGDLEHRHQPLECLAVQAAAVQRTILARAGVQLARIGTRPRQYGTPMPARPAMRSIPARQMGPRLQVVSLG